MSCRVCAHLKAAGRDAVHVGEKGLTGTDDLVILEQGPCARLCSRDRHAKITRYAPDDLSRTNSLRAARRSCRRGLRFWRADRASGPAWGYGLAWAAGHVSCLGRA